MTAKAGEATYGGAEEAAWKSCFLEAQSDKELSDRMESRGN